MPDLVTLANVKSYLWPGETSTKWDAILPEIIAAVSEQVKKEVGCEMAHTHYTAVAVSGRGISCLDLPNWPITAASSVASADGAVYAAGYNRDYVIESLCLRRVGGVWAAGSANFIVSYEAGFTAIPSDVALVCYEVVARKWKTMKEQGWGESGRTMPDGSTSTVNADAALTKAQKDILSKYRRMVV